MKRFVLTGLLVLCFLHAAPIYAKDIVSMRSAVRQAYSRLVFDWKGDVKYTLDQSEKGKVIISFSRAADPETKNIDLSSLANIGEMTVLSTDPLKISFIIPDSSKVRAFTTADRVFLDVYNPPDGLGLAKKAAEEKKTDEPPKPETEQTAQVKEQVKAPKEKPLPKGAIASPPAYVLTPEVVRPEVKKDEPAPVKKDEIAETPPVNQGEHVISVNATSAFDMAIFENYGALWFVMDKEGFSMKPKITSAEPALFGEMQSVPLESGVAYHMAYPENLAAKSQGGGLAWRLILGEPGKITPNPPVVPVRRTSGMKSMRDGKVIWPLNGVGKILKTKDPVTGQDLVIVTVKDALQASGEAISFTDFDVLKSFAGLVIRPKVDDLIVNKTAEGIEISRADGLALLPPGIIAREKDAEKPFFSPAEIKPAHTESVVQDAVTPQHTEPPKEKKKESFVSEPSTLFNFEDWKMGETEELNRNETLILSTIKDKDDAGQVDDLMRLAKMYLSHGLGPEALGFLEFALQKQPALKDSPEFKAMRGIARAFTYKSEISLADLLDKNLEDFDEIKIWKSYVLADLGDWKQAAEILPQKSNVIFAYPDYIANRLALALAEVYLRAGKKDEAEKLLAFVESKEDTLDESGTAALTYLKGEAFRQRGDLGKTVELWTSLKDSKDDLYRTKAQLALTVLLKEKKDIDLKEVIDRLERLRYAWRGDQLEAQINYWLGKAYFEKRDFIKGLNILREAASIAIDTDLGKRIVLDMSDTFQNLFFDKAYQDVSALDAVTVYQQFNELVPRGAKGNELVQKLAERLVEADLLERAAELLRQQVNHRLAGEEKIRVGVRLAAIELMDKRPAQALISLGVAERELAKTADTPSKAARQREISLLKARALSQDGKSGDGLQILEALPPSADVNRLKADIAWQQGYWPDAAAALGDVLEQENISATTPLTEKQTALIMNRAIALSLANDRVELANMRNKYSDLMLQSPKARQFEVITRPRGNAELADKDTLKSIMSEVDLFGDFLESYKQAGQ